MLFEKMKTKNKTKTPIWCSQAVLGDNESCVHGCCWWKACFILLLLFEDLGEGWGRGHCFPERVAGPSSVKSFLMCPRASSFKAPLQWVCLILKTQFEETWRVGPKMRKHLGGRSSIRKKILRYHCSCFACMTYGQSDVHLL